MDQFRAQLRQDRWLHLFVGCYALATFAVTVAAGRPDRFVPLLYAQAFWPALQTAALLVLVAIGLASLGAPRPGAHFESVLRSSGGEFLASGLMLGSTIVFYGLFTSLKNCFPEIAPFRHDALFADLDAALHFGSAPWRLLQPFVCPQLTGVLEYIYLHIWWIVLQLAVGGCILAPKCRPHRQQFLWSLFLTWTLLGSVVAALGSSVGPIFYERLTGSGRYHELVAYLSYATRSEMSASNYLWAEYRTGAVGLGSGISAFPSMHVASAALIALLGHRLGAWTGAVTTAFAAVILVSSVHLGWHYAVDGYTSVVATLLIWKAVDWALRPQPALQYAMASA